MVVLDDLDHSRLVIDVIDVIDRVPGLAVRHAEQTGGAEV